MPSTPPGKFRYGLAVLTLISAACAPVHATDVDATRSAEASAAAQDAGPAPAQKATATSSSFRGKLSWYGRQFAGLLTASGQPFDPDAMTMAHPTLPFGTLVRITNLANLRSAVVMVNDRGPFVRSRVGDVSAAAARELRMRSAGVITARFEVVGSENPDR